MKIINYLKYTVTVVLSVWMLCMPNPVFGAVADFCWCGFLIPSLEDDHFLERRQVFPVFRKHARSFEEPENGAIHKLLKQLQWDEMTYYGYVGFLSGNSDKPSGASPQVENLTNTYGFFISIDQIIPFEPDEITVFEDSYKTYATYLFGSINLFNLETRNLLYSRPFLVTHQGKNRLTPPEMVDYSLKEFANRLADPQNRFTGKMLKDLQDYFGEKGEQKDAIRMVQGALADTFGVMPVCDRCVRTSADSDNLNEKSKKRLRHFARLFFNVKLADFKQVVMVPERHANIRQSVHTFVVQTKEGDVRFVESAFSNYDESGQTLLRINIPEPSNQIKLSLGYVVKELPVTENAVNRQYNTLLNILVRRPDTDKKEIHSLTNRFEKVITGSRKTSDVYYFNSLINAISGLNDNLF